MSARNLTQHYLYSQQFSSCAPIVLFNRNDNTGGLYHFAGGPMGHKQKNDLDLMALVIDPTDVYIFHGLGSFDEGTGGMAITTSHVEGVRKFFNDSRPNVKVHLGDGNVVNVGTIGVCVQTGALHFDFQDTGHIDLPLNTSGNISRLPTDCQFFGEADSKKLSKWM